MNHRTHIIISDIIRESWNHPEDIFLDCSREFLVRLAARCFNAIEKIDAEAVGVSLLPEVTIRDCSRSGEYPVGDSGQ